MPSVGISLSESKSHGELNFVMGLVLAVLATIAVMLRIISSYHTQSLLKLDLQWIIVALLGLYGYTTSVTWGVFMSNGAPNQAMIQEHPHQSRAFLRSTFLYIEFFNLANTAIKLSAIMLYRRVFPTVRILRVSIYMIIACCVWWGMCAIQWPLICQPLSLYWAPSTIRSLTLSGGLGTTTFKDVQGSCSNVNAFLFVAEGGNVLLDHVVLATPLPLLWRLHTTRQRRVGLCALFGLGALSCVSALIRLCVMFKPTRFYPDLVAGQIWGSLHLTLGIICACVPSYRILATKAGERVGRWKEKIYGSTSFGSSSDVGASNGQQNALGQNGSPIPRPFQEKRAELVHSPRESLEQY